MTKVVYRDRYIARRDTVTRDVPRTRIIYRRQTDTVRVAYPVPVRDTVRLVGLVSDRPLRIRPGSVTLTVWRPDSLRYEQQVYRVPRPRWGFWGDVGAGWYIDGPSVDLRVNARYRGLTAYGGVAVTQDHAGPVIGVRVKLFGSQ